MATLLVAREVPEAGGDTLFANQYLAYDTLSEKLRGLLSKMHGVASSAKADASRTREDRIRSTAAPRHASFWLPSIRAVRTHPETGRKVLYRKSCAYGEFRRHDGRRERATTGVPVPSSDPAGIHLPVPLDPRRIGDLGQSLCATLRGE